MHPETHEFIPWNETLPSFSSRSSTGIAEGAHVPTVQNTVSNKHLMQGNGKISVIKLNNYLSYMLTLLIEKVNLIVKINPSRDKNC